MQDQIPSRTAWRVAARRAAHQIFDTPRVFDDPLALRILGPEGARAVEHDSENREQTRVARALRAFMAVRSRIAEDELARAVAAGVAQAVILGAGLDTFAYRNPYSHLRVFEVDHPATQAWKRELLWRAGITIPGSLTYVPVNFERQVVADQLAIAGLRLGESVFFSWLGVTMYLALETVMTMLALVASFPSGSAVVFDYSIAPALLGLLERLALQAFSRRVAAVGEPWTLSFDPAVLVGDLRRIGFGEVEDLGPAEINGRYFAHRADRLGVGSLAHVMVARR